MIIASKIFVAFVAKSTEEANPPTDDELKACAEFALRAERIFRRLEEEDYRREMDERHKAGSKR